MRRHTQAFGKALGVVGLINVQYAIRGGVVYVLEVNPRASRTVPFVSKATGVPLAKLAAAGIVGRTLGGLCPPAELPVARGVLAEAGVPLSQQHRLGVPLWP